MKAFIISICTLSILFAFTVLNGIYINKVTAKLMYEAEKIELNPGSVNEFSNMWRKYQFIINISSSHKETHRIDEGISILKKKASANISEGFEEEKTLLIEYFFQIGTDERVSIGSII